MHGTGEISMIYCPICGHRNGPHVTDCSICGYQLREQGELLMGRPILTREGWVTLRRAEVEQ